jgi:hypothetical protein
MGHVLRRKGVTGITVPYFDPNVIKSGETIYVNGKRGTGKTKLIIDLMAYMRDVSHVVVVCPTIEAANTYAKHVPSLFIYNKWSPEIVNRLLACQRSLGNSVSDYPCLIVFDDCLFDPKFARDASTRELYMNGRHANISVICAGQYMMDLPPAIRTNTDYCLMMTENCKANREKLFKNFGGPFDDFASFNDVMIKCTGDYNALVMNNKTNSNELSDCVSYYKATLGLRFRVGSDELHEWAAERTAPTSDDASGFDNGAEMLPPTLGTNPTRVIAQLGKKPRSQA